MARSVPFAALGEPEGTAIHLPAASNGSDGHDPTTLSVTTISLLTVSRATIWSSSKPLSGRPPAMLETLPLIRPRMILSSSSRTSVMFLETRLQADRGFSFVKMDTHENAAMAICQLNGYTRQRPALEVQCMSSPLYPLNLVY